MVWMFWFAAAVLAAMTYFAARQARHNLRLNEGGSRPSPAPPLQTRPLHWGRVSPQSRAR